MNPKTLKKKLFLIQCAASNLMSDALTLAKKAGEMDREARELLQDLEVKKQKEKKNEAVSVRSHLQPEV